MDFPGGRLALGAGKAYLADMSKLLDKALEAVRRLPREGQDAIAQAMLNLAGEDDPAEEIDRHICRMFWRGSRKLGVASLRAMPKSKPSFAISIDEAAVYAAVAR